MPKIRKYVKFKIYERIIKLLFMIYVDFESILVPEDKRNQNPKETYKNIFQKHIAWTYGYKLACIDDKFNSPFKAYLGEDTVHNFVKCMIEESKYCSDKMKKHFTKELVRTKEDNENFRNSSKCWICDNDYVNNDAKVISLSYHWKI